MSEPEPQYNTGLDVLAFTGIVLFMAACAYANYRLKIDRSDREETFMYRIYQDIIRAETNFDQDKDHIIREISANLS